MIIDETSQTTIQPQISLTIMNQSNGSVEALVGGRDLKTSDLSLNRATLQPDSLDQHLRFCLHFYQPLIKII